MGESNDGSAKLGSPLPFSSELWELPSTVSCGSAVDSLAGETDASAKSDGSCKTDREREREREGEREGRNKQSAWFCVGSNLLWRAHGVRGHRPWLQIHRPDWF